MPKVHSHYENLKVARNAPPEIIRAAYRALSLKYHPDRNPGNRDAARITSIINSAYTVLSDPEKRRIHDIWIATSEGSEIESQPQPDREISREEVAHTPIYKFLTARQIYRTFAQRIGVGIVHIRHNWYWYAAASLLIILLEVYRLNSGTRTDSVPTSSVVQTAPAPVTQTPASARTAAPTTVTPAAPVPPVMTAPAPEAPGRSSWDQTKAPNGQPWPATSGYIYGYEQVRDSGLSNITIDNMQNDSDVFVKLVWLDGERPTAVRFFFVAGRDSFTLRQVTAGRYDIRYRTVRNGNMTASEAFAVTEEYMLNGTKFSNIRMTLYKVIDGNMQTRSISESEFDL